MSVGCESNDDCPDYAACQNRKCINPCAEGRPCAPTAICKAFDHQAVCTCPDGFLGSPLISCERRKFSMMRTSSFQVILHVPMFS